MTGVSPYSAMLAAAFALVSERCRQAYIHDLKGGLQSVHSAMELLSRSAAMSPVNTPMIEKATSLARRALATHESELFAFMLKSAPRGESLSTVDLGGLVAEIVRLLRSDALARSIIIRPEVRGNVSIVSEAHELRMLILGLCVTNLDVLPPNAILTVTVDDQAGSASICIAAEPAHPKTVVAIDDWLAHQTQPITSHEFLLGVTAEWARRRGGNLSVHSAGAATSAVLSLPASRSSNAEN